MVSASASGRAKITNSRGVLTRALPECSALTYDGREIIWEAIRMRTFIALTAAVAAMTGAALAAQKLTPKEIQTEFFDGKSFIAATTSGTKFKMTFATD